MRIMRAYIMLLPLVLAACSLPTKQSSPTSANPEPKPDTIVIPPISNKVEPTQPKVAKEPKETVSQDLKQTLSTQQKLAAQNIGELENRVGTALPSPDQQAVGSDSSEQVRQRISNLEAFNASLTQKIFELDQRVEHRRQSPEHGDMLKVFLSDLAVSHDRTFKAQPLVGHWVRGESRAVRLNENLLAANSNSEPLRLTFSERYQVLVNDELIGSFGPNRSKYEVDFEAPTVDGEGTISGTLTIRIPSN